MKSISITIYHLKLKKLKLIKWKNDVNIKLATDLVARSIYTWQTKKSYVHFGYLRPTDTVCIGGLVRLALARWAGWSTGQVGHRVKC